MLFFVILPLAAVYQETIRQGASINNLIRFHVYKQGNLHDYLAEDVTKQPYDKDVPICDYKTLTPKRFFLDYVRKGRPCLFPDYART